MSKPIERDRFLPVWESCDKERRVLTLYRKDAPTYAMFRMKVCDLMTAVADDYLAKGAVSVKTTKQMEQMFPKPGMPNSIEAAWWTWFDKLSGGLNHE